jgi:retron-type reverse transcriptase
LSLKKKVITIIEDLQKLIAQLSLKKSLKFALKYVERFCFSLIIRVNAIEKIRIKKKQKINIMSTITKKNIQYFKNYLNLLKKTEFKNVAYTENMKVQYIKILKKKVNKVRVLRISNLIDRILQIQFHTLLDPLFDINLPELFFGFRKRRNIHQALAYLYQSISFSNMNQFYLLYMNITGCFNNIFHKYILKYFYFPKKYKKLLIR